MTIFQPKDPKPTPGKWYIERPCGFPYTGIFIVSHSANDSKQFHHYIAEVRQLRERGESLANAALLVAAKETAFERDRLKEVNAEILEALGQTEIILTLIFGETGEDHISNYALDCRNVTVRAAIAKAHEVQGDDGELLSVKCRVCEEPLAIIAPGVDHICGECKLKTKKVTDWKKYKLKAERLAQGDDDE